MLRDYLAEVRERLAKNGTKIKLRIYKPLAEEEMAVMSTSAITKYRKKGDFHTAVIDKCMTQWTDDFRQVRVEAGPPSDELMTQLVDQLFVQILERSPSADEQGEYLSLAKSYVAKLGNLKAIQKLIQTVMLSSEFVYRQEFGHGEARRAWAPDALATGCQLRNRLRPDRPEPRRGA